MTVKAKAYSNTHSSEFEGTVRIGIMESYASMKTVYYFAIDGQLVGPLDEGEFKQRIIGHTITYDTLAWCEGMKDWQPVRTIPELLQACGPEESVEGRPPPLPGVSGTAGQPPPPSSNKVQSDPEPPLEGSGREKASWTADNLGSQRGGSYGLLLRILPKRSPLRPYLEHNPGMAIPILVMALAGLLLIIAFLIDLQTEEAEYAEQPPQQQGMPMGDWPARHRAWQDAQQYNQGILDDTYKRKLESDNRMDDLRRRATFPDLYGGDRD